ncbi:hypothetical protein CEP53_011870 [Fusarium sp. AF-6]|nr:hypothetical protein CEP53_011870 [Fusarium sp. AF-6]
MGPNATPTVSTGILILKRKRDEDQTANSPRKAAKNSKQHSEAQGEAMTAEEVLSRVTMEELTTMYAEAAEKVLELEKQHEEAVSRLTCLQEFSRLKEKDTECEAAKHAAKEAMRQSTAKSAEFDRLLTAASTEEWKVILPAKEKEGEDLYTSD